MAQRARRSGGLWYLVMGVVFIVTAVVVLFLTGLGEPAGEGIEAALRWAAVSGQVPKDLMVVYDDVHPLYGGTTIEVRGNGTVRRSDRSRGQAKARVKTGKANREDLAKLIRELVDLEAWTQKTVERSAVPDESRAELKITIGDNTGGFWEWYNELERNKRLSRIRERLDHLVPPTP